MPFIGIGFHVLIALFFAVHVVRTGREMYWLFILFAFPLLGSIVYFIAVYWPSTRMQHSVRKTLVSAARSLDPGRDLREAQEAFDLAPTAQNRMRLADALLARLAEGDAKAAVEHLEACLQGPLANDPEIRFGAARAHLENGEPDAALAHLAVIGAQSPNFRPEPVVLLSARAHALAGQNQEARADFEAAIQRFGSFEAHAEYAIWAAGVGDTETATAQREEIDRAMQHWSSHTREINAPLLRRLQDALETGQKR